MEHSEPKNKGGEKKRKKEVIRKNVSDRKENQESVKFGKLIEDKFFSLHHEKE